MDKFNYLKEQLTAALATWQQTNGGKTTVGWMHAANPEVIAALLAELESKSAYAADWCHLAKKRKDALDDANKRIAELEAGHQEAAKQIASWRRIAKQNIEEREKDLAALDAERQKITGLEAKLATPVRLPSFDCYKPEAAKELQEGFKNTVRAAGFTVEGDSE